MIGFYELTEDESSSPARQSRRDVREYERTEPLVVLRISPTRTPPLKYKGDVKL
jgi:hypothetical protein